MIEIEGRVLAGLDEFMLRAGHLVVLCRIAREVGGSWTRIHREAADRFSQSVEIEPDENHGVAVYLATKGLCRRVDKTPLESSTDKEFVYPNLEVFADEARELAVRSISGDGPVEVSWQDRNLAALRIRSRVGAITWSAKSGSKTGLSHVCDWAQFLDLIDSSGQLTPIGRLLAALTQENEPAFRTWNPYDLGRSSLILAYQYLQKDIDLFAHFAPLLLSERAPLSKATCRTLFVKALRACASEADESRNVASHRRFELAQQIRDLERAARKSRTEIEETSTAWHRAASRVEMFTDFGFLEKNRAAEDEKFKYIYYPTEQLESAVKTLALAKTGDAWIDEYLLATILESPSMKANESVSASDKELAAGLRTIVDGLKLPTTQYPIDCLVLGLAYLNSSSLAQKSLKELREIIESIPARYPGVARLARGPEGMRAEYLSINIRNLAEL